MKILELLFEPARLAAFQQKYKCYVCGKASTGPERREIFIGYESDSSEYPVLKFREDVDWKNPQDLTYDRNGHWVCKDHRRGDYCTSCMPSWQKQIEEAEQHEISAQLKEEAKQKQREKEQKRCHVCGQLGNDQSAKCRKCNQWTCSIDLYKGICRSCAEHL